MKINNIILILFVLILIISVILYCFLYNNNFNDVTSDLVEGFSKARARGQFHGGKGTHTYQAPRPPIAHASAATQRWAKDRARKLMAHTPTQHHNNRGQSSKVSDAWASKMAVIKNRHSNYYSNNHHN